MNWFFEESPKCIPPVSPFKTPSGLQLNANIMIEDQILLLLLCVSVFVTLPHPTPPPTLVISTK